MKKTIKYIVITVLCVLLAVVVGYTVKGYSMYRQALKDTPVEEKIESIRASEDYTKLSELPAMYVKAVVAAEDRRFYSHNGVDYIAVMRAIITDIKQMKLVEGGSTITQQLVKNTFFSQSRKLERKIAEVFMAWKLEKMYEKDEILELYVNSIYFGSGYYSISAAANGYFDKSPAELTDYECTMLAGLPNAPSVYSLDNNPDLAEQRRIQVVNKMVTYGYITETEGEALLNATA